MDKNVLSQEERDMLLKNEDEVDGTNKVGKEIAMTLEPMEQDILGEVGNISMGAASTSLSDLTGRKVSITTPKVTLTTINDIKKEIVEPAVIVEVEYTEGIIGHNVLILHASDACVICDLMMAKEPSDHRKELTELEMSAVSEAMNQMIGSAATAMSILFELNINISTPNSMLYGENNRRMTNEIDEDEIIARITFDLVIEGALHSNIMMLLTSDTAKRIISRMTGETEHYSDEIAEVKSEISNPEDTALVNNAEANDIDVQNAINSVLNNSNNSNNNNNNEYIAGNTTMNTSKNMNSSYSPQNNVGVNKAAFSEIEETRGKTHNNIDLILDVPLEVSVLLGRAKKSIKDVLEFSNGSLIELDKLAEEPVEILVNGKQIAKGEVVVIDENFGVRITDIISGVERVKTLR